MFLRCTFTGVVILLQSCSLPQAVLNVYMFEAVAKQVIK